MSRYSGRVSDLILKALGAGGPMVKRDLCRITGRDYVEVDYAVLDLKRAGRIRVLGVARDVGLTHVRWDSPVFGLPEQKLPKATPRKRERTHSGSGVIAGPVTIGRGFAQWPGPRSAR